MSLMPAEDKKEDNPLAVRTAEILLGETMYSVREATRRRARKFWPILIEEIKPAMQGVSSAVKLDGSSSSDDLVAILPHIEKIITQTPERIIDALCAYDAALESAKKTIEEEATDRQLIHALLALLEMSDPFGLKNLIRGGLRGLMTSKSSPEPSGE